MRPMSLLTRQKSSLPLQSDDTCRLILGDFHDEQVPLNINKTKCFQGFLSGASCGTRTRDLLITNQVVKIKKDQ